MDTSLISSNEELSPEDRLLLTCTKRQEPQGEEHKTESNVDTSSKQHQYAQQVLGLTRTKKKLPSSPSSSEEETDSDTQDDEENHDTKEHNYYNTGGAVGGTSNVNSRSSLHRNSGTHPCNLSLDSTQNYNTLIIHNNNNSLLADTWM